MTKNYESLLGMHKKRFQCLIDDIFCVGVIAVNRHSVYLCQNMCYGDNPNDTIGYKYGWYVGTGTPNELENNKIKEFVIIDTELSADTNDYEEISRAIGLSQVLTDDQADIFVSAFKLGMEYVRRLQA